MAGERTDLVEIDAKGIARPVGETASLRLQGRQGRFPLPPAPSHMVVLRKVGAKGGEARACAPAGEIRSPGALCDIFGFIGHAGWNGELRVLERCASRS